MKISTNFRIGYQQFTLEFESEELISKEVIARKVNAASIAAKTIANNLQENDIITVSKSPMQEQPREDTGNHESSGDGGMLVVSKLVVEGTLENPVIKMYSANEKLKFPVLTCPYNVLARVIQSSYPGIEHNKIEKFAQCGSIHAVDWLVYWIPSPKNARYKDISRVQVRSQGGSE